MTEGLPKVQAVDQWVSLIRESADQRGLRATLIRATEALESGKYPLPKVRDRLMERILGLGTVQNPSLTHGEALGKAVAAQIDLRCGPRLIGVPTGLPTLDRWTHGVRGVWVVGASTSVGKTAFACQLAMEACRSGVKCLYFSTEMTAADIGLRMVCSEERVSIWDLKVDPMALDGVLRRVGDVPKWGLAIDETSPLTPEHVYSTMRSWRQAHGVGLVIVDHIQHMSGGKSESRNQELTAISRALQQASRSMNVPLVILSQLSRDRAKQQRRPRLDDLRDSGSIEQDADLVMLIHRNNIADAESQLPHDAEFIVAKHRHGATGVVEMTFQPTWTRFEERV